MAGIEAFERVKGKYFCLTRTPENFFTSEGMGPVSFPLKVRLTSIMNEQLEAVVNALKNNVIIPSDIQFSESKIRGKRTVVKGSLLFSFRARMEGERCPIDKENCVHANL